MAKLKNETAAGDAAQPLGTFQLQGTVPHFQAIPPVMAGQTIVTPATYKIIQPGQTYTASGSEAASYRRDPDKHKEL